MNGFEPIIYIISAIGAEIIKDVGKHLGKKAHEIATSLQEPIIQLGISDYTNSQEIQQKLEDKPELKSVIEKTIGDNQEDFDKLLKILKDNDKLPFSKFYSQGNEKVINIETNHGPINM